MRYVILGGGGSFGINCALYLLDQADTDLVIGIGRSPLRPEPFSLGVEKRAHYAYNVRHLVHELDETLALLDAIEPDVIVNFAAQGEGAVSWQHSWRFFETNCVALSKLTEALMQREYLKRFVQIGTSELYGSVSAPATEDAPIKPSSPYAASKAAFDLHLMAINRTLGFPMNIIRPSNAYCPGQLLHRVIPRAIVCGLTGRKLPLQGGGRAEKSYIHAEDLARAIHLVATKAPLGAVYNAGPREPISIRALVETIAEQIGIAFEDLCEITDDRPGQDARYWLDSSAIKNAVGWEPEIGLVDGVHDMIRWAHNHIETLRTWPQTYELRP